MAVLAALFAHRFYGALLPARRARKIRSERPGRVRQTARWAHAPRWCRYGNTRFKLFCQSVPSMCKILLIRQTKLLVANEHRCGIPLRLIVDKSRSQSRNQPVNCRVVDSAHPAEWTAQYPMSQWSAIRKRSTWMYSRLTVQVAHSTPLFRPPR